MRGGVLQLDRWGLLDPDRRRRHAADHRHTLPLRRPTSRPIALDRAARRAARRAGPCSTPRCSTRPRRPGVEARFGVRRRPACRATAPAGSPASRPAPRRRPDARTARRLTVGADGLRSGVARAGRAPAPPGGARAASAFVYGYWPGPPADRATEWFYRPGGSAGVIPTNDGQVCVWAGLPARAVRRRARRRARRAVRPRARPRPPRRRPSWSAGGARGRPLRGFPGVPAYLRPAVGTGLGAGRRRRATSRTRSPRTASPTRCATPSCSPGPR